MLSNNPQCIFVHIPKTGGSSIEVALTGYDWITANATDYGIYLREHSLYTPSWGGELCERNEDYFAERMPIKHATQSQLAASHPDEWATHLKFTFVRNPFDRVLAIHRHGLRDAAERTPADFKTWLMQPEPTDHMGHPVFAPMIHDWSELDFVGRFEHLARDFEALCERLGIPGTELPHVAHGNHRGPKAPTAECYDATARELVANRCRDELERFDYRFPESVAV